MTTAAIPGRQDYTSQVPPGGNRNPRPLSKFVFSFEARCPQPLSSPETDTGPLSEPVLSERQAIPVSCELSRYRSAKGLNRALSSSGLSEPPENMHQR